MKITPAKLDEMNKSSKNKTSEWIKVGMSTCGIAAGADIVLETLSAEKKKHNLGITVGMCGCAGSCFAEPLVEVKVEGMPTVIYGRVDKDTAIKIIEKHVIGGILLDDHI